MVEPTEFADINIEQLCLMLLFGNGKQSIELSQVSLLLQGQEVFNKVL